ncbi:FAD/NAD(P)-binding domain-containing protein [Xylariaceae sp. FL0662B]|nr:FAD/NAD(P)-binding domain-containing protein [Xylariaceae sp. FL0662B]
MRIAIIGGGPSGLATLKYLLAAERTLGTKPVDVRLFESESSVGGTFLARMYEDAELVSSRQLTSFSDFRYNDDPDFLSADRYLEYLNEYCTHFNLWPYMNFSCLVTSLRKGNDGDHTITYMLKGHLYTWECDAVAVCSGLHVDPSIPQIQGIQKVPLVFHSSELKSREQFGNGKTVLVLGSGETGADVSFLAVTSPTKRVVMCHRDGFHLAPKKNPNPMLIFSRKRSSSDRPQVPIDASRASLFDTAYVHPWLRNSNILWTYYDCYVRWILWISWGTIHGTDQWIGGKPRGWSTSEIFFNKSGSKISPYLNTIWKPATPQGFLRYIRSWIVQDSEAETPGRKLELAPWPERINENGVVQFRDNGRPEYAYMKDKIIKPDVIVFCTGYNPQFPFLANKAPYYDYVREIWPEEDPSIGFIGFVRPNLGAIPPLAEMQAQLWVLKILAPERLGPVVPDDEPHYRLKYKKGARIRYGVDHESYTYQLALDMGSAPSFFEVIRIGLRGPQGCWWKLPLTWALGANFNTKFRLRGPWRWDGAVEVMAGELWDTVARRELFFGHFTLSVVPMLVFGPISLLVYLCACLCQFLQSLTQICKRRENRGNGAVHL